jgi:hypothetical protein
MKDDLQPIASRVLYEDDEVRIWDQQIEAGKTLGRHRHEHDYVIVTVRGGGPLDVEFHAGTGGALGGSLSLPRSRRGEALFVEKGHVETAHNRGETMRAILVELKKGDEKPRR